MTNKKYQTPRIIHQIFIDMGKGDIYSAAGGRFYESHQMTRRYCKHHNLKYRLWTEDRIVTLLGRKYLKFYKDLREPIQKVDFAKYLILYCYGGIYMDLDVSIIPGKTLDHLFSLDLLIVRWNDSKLPYNAILGCSRKNPVFLDIIKQSQMDYNEKIKRDVYKRWIGRFVFQTTGHYMLQRALRKNGISPSQYQNILYIISKGVVISAPDPIFLDTNESVWYLD